MNAPTASRRHDIDALRALAFALLILYHWAMLYVAEWEWHLKSTHLAEWAQFPMLFVNRWRMDLVFLVSGLSVSLLLRADTRSAGTPPASTPPASTRPASTRPAGIRRFAIDRTRRLLWPLAFGMLVVVPIQPYAQGVANGLVEPGFVAFLARYYTFAAWPEGAFDGWEHGFTWNHLWYLAYLWVYTLVLAALLPALRSPWGLRLRQRLTGLRGWRLLLLPAVPLALATVGLQPHFEETGDLIHDWYRHAIYFSVFLYGYWLGNDAPLWGELVRLRRRSLGLALAVFAVYLPLTRLLPDDGPFWHTALIYTLRNVYIWAALCAILGWSHAHLNRPLRWLPWANEAVYPWYVLHQSLIVLIAYWLLPLHLGPWIEPALVLAGTVLGCWALHAWVIRGNRWLRPCFGLKPLARTPAVNRSPEAVGVR